MQKLSVAQAVWRRMIGWLRPRLLFRRYSVRSRRGHRLFRVSFLVVFEENITNQICRYTCSLNVIFPHIEKLTIHCYAVCVTKTGFGLVKRFIFHLYTPLVFTNNYNVTANLHNSQITTAPTKPFQPALFLLAFSWQRLLMVEILQLHALTPFPAGHRLTTELTLY
jgi:hypothetical protein